jgi:hypothetical protein
VGLGPSQKKLLCTVSGVEVDGTELQVRYSPIRGHPGPIQDSIRFLPAGDPAVVRGVGRFLRILRAGRIRAPAAPYALWDDMELAASLARRCQGARVVLTVQRRTERMLTVWTEEGVEHIPYVLDFEESGDQLVVRRRGGLSALYLPRQRVVRYEASSSQRLEVVSLEAGDG